MKRAYAASKYAKPYERYCREQFPEEAEEIFKGAEVWYQKYMEDMPDLGKNMMAANMLDWFTILAFYEASGHRLDGNKNRWPYKLFERTYVQYNKKREAHLAKGEWKDSWQVEIKVPH